MTASKNKTLIDVDFVKEASTQVEQLLEKPDWVLDHSAEEAKTAAAAARSFLKVFVDSAHARVPARVQKLSHLGLKGLIVKGFDADQIWEELEVQNLPLRRHLRHSITRLGKGKVTLKTQPAAPKAASKDSDEEPPVAKGKKKATKGKKSADEELAELAAGFDMDDDEDIDLDAIEAMMQKKDKKKKKKSKPVADDEDEDEEEAAVPAKKAGKKAGKKGADAGVGDEGGDDIFDLEEMRKFADEADEGKIRLDMDANDSDFDELEDGGEDAEDAKARTALYSDFFTADEKPAKKEKGKKKTIQEEDEEDDDDEKAVGAADMEDGEEEDDDEDDEEEESEFEIQGEGAEDLSDEEKALEKKLERLQADREEGSDSDVTGKGGDSEEEGEEDDDKEEDEEDDEDGDAERAPKKGKSKKNKSLYEMDKSLRALEEEVQKLEEEQLAEKSWELKGEVSGRQRPLNSLLEMHLDQPMSYFAGRRAEDAAVNAGGDDEDNEELEDLPGVDGMPTSKKFDIDGIIKQRVWDEVFDDVVRKAAIPPSQRKQNSSDDMVETLSFEKSRVGLGDIYAKQYEAELLGHKTDAEQKESAEKTEAKALFAKIMFKLDQLTNAHFTPRPPMLGVSADAMSKVPSLKMEETIPLMVSDAHLHAPEEIKAARRHDREQAELTHDEKTAVRRASKAKRKKALERKVESGEMSLAGMRERAEKLGQKNKDAKLEKSRQGQVKEQKKRIKSMELLTQASQNVSSGMSRKEEMRAERSKRAPDAPTSKRLKL